MKKIAALSIVGLMAVGALSQPSTVFAVDVDSVSSTEASSDEAKLFTGPDGEFRSVSAIQGENGIEFDIEDTDELSITDDSVLVKDEGGNLLFEIAPELTSDEELYLNSDDDTVHIVSTVVQGRSLIGTKATKAKCAGKGSQWIIRSAWTGLVCVPATIGSGVTGPGAVAVAAGCGVAGDGLATAAAC